MKAELAALRRGDDVGRTSPSPQTTAAAPPAPPRAEPPTTTAAPTQPASRFGPLPSTLPRGSSHALQGDPFASAPPPFGVAPTADLMRSATYDSAASSLESGGSPGSHVFLTSPLFTSTLGFLTAKGLWRGEFIQDVSKRKNRTSESEVRFRLKPSYTPSRQNPYHLNPLPRRLGKINHRFKTRYFFLWFLLYNIYVRVFAPSTPPEGAWLCLV